VFNSFLVSEDDDLKEDPSLAQLGLGRVETQIAQTAGLLIMDFFEPKRFSFWWSSIP
jgi:hypothetical protein